MTAWAVVERCAGQLRTNQAGPFALDYSAVLMMADAMGACTSLLVDVLPAVEAIIVKAYRDASPE
jgi:hypothetical protein